MSKCGKPYLSLEDPKSDLCEETGNSLCKLNVQKENAPHTMQELYFIFKHSRLHNIILELQRNIYKFK